MADILPINFPLPSERATANYNYIDIAEGTGVIDFNGFKAEVSGAITYKLSTNAPYSSDIETQHDTSNPTTFNFDLTPFNLPKIVKGTAIVRFTVAHKKVTGNIDNYYIINIYKVSGSTHTVIGTQISERIGSAATVITNYTIPISLTQTNFKKGDYLRLQINSYLLGTDELGYLGHDPGNRAGTNITPTSTYPTTLNLYMPFLLDL